MVKPLFPHQEQLHVRETSISLPRGRNALSRAAQPLPTAHPMPFQVLSAPGCILGLMTWSHLQFQPGLDHEVLPLVVLLGPRVSSGSSQPFPCSIEKRNPICLQGTALGWLPVRLGHRPLV